MDTRANERFKRVMQVLAILGLLFICLIIFHKGYTDVSALAQSHSGESFWRALARYIFRNLAG